MAPGTPAAPLDPATGLVVFTLLRGGALINDYHSFINSRRCLRDVFPNWVHYDVVGFHEGNVPTFMWPMLLQQV
eukprot:865535-Prymnesium_polylepis.1